MRDWESVREREQKKLIFHGAAVDAIATQRDACVWQGATKEVRGRLDRDQDAFSWQDVALRVYYLILLTSCVEISSHKSMKRLAQVYN